MLAALGYQRLRRAGSLLHAELSREMLGRYYSIITRWKHVIGPTPESRPRKDTPWAMRAYATDLAEENFIVIDRIIYLEARPLG